MKVFETFIGQWGLVLPIKLVTSSACFDSICNFQNLRFYANLRLKISVTKFRDSKIWVDTVNLTVSKYFPSAFSWCAPFFSRCCFHEGICETKWALLQFLGEKWKKPLSSGKFVPLKTFPDFFYLSPSSSPVRKEHFALKNFNQGPKMSISGLVA